MRPATLDRFENEPVATLHRRATSLALELASGGIDGIRFPSKGTYRQMPLGELPDITYAFEVIGCERLDQVDRENWFPVWPAGILVKDQVLGQNHVVKE